VAELPLPPYIQRPHGPDAEDWERYQTVYASVPGSVAAPTAGLHFTRELLAELGAGGIAVAAVTLHVGPATFQPVRTEDLRQHELEGEAYFVGAETVEAVAAARESGGRVIAVGTTTTRALEAACDARGVLRAGEGVARLFLRPGHRFRVVHGLITNFHLPRSSLLMLVSAFLGRRRVLAVYAEALARGYRFYSYGDAMAIFAARGRPGPWPGRAA
jgi:S-adenosylmethionine:tRNA ribosyltransferase-isomerase